MVVKFVLGTPSLLVVALCNMSCLTVGATLPGRTPEVDGGVFNLSIIFLIWLIFVGPETCDEEPAGYFRRFVG